MTAQFNDPSSLCSHLGHLRDLRDSREFHRTYRLFIAETLINLVGPFTSAFCLRDLEEGCCVLHTFRAGEGTRLADIIQPTLVVRRILYGS